MKDVLTALKLQVERTSLVETASLLGHSNTQTISRWIRQEKIPTASVKGVQAILDANKKKASK